MLKNNNKAFSTFYFLLGLILFLPSPSYADSPGIGDTPADIVYVDALDGHEHIQMKGKRVRFKLHDNLTAPLCDAPNCSRLRDRSNPNDEPEQLNGGADE